MHWVRLVVCFAALMIPPAIVQAKSLGKNEAAFCNWGGGMAALAQKSFLQGKPQAEFKSALQSAPYPQPWMPSMAGFIAETTYSKRSADSPDRVEKDYVHDCIQRVLDN